MKTYFIMVSTPKKMKGRFHTDKGIVAGVNDADEAIQVARRRYGPHCTGWDENARFSATEIRPNEFFSV